MAQVGSVATRKMVEALRAPGGLGSSVASIAQNAGAELPAIPEERIIGQRVAAELAEKSPGVKYPAMYVYCDRIKNSLTEKFRRFSGKARVVIEVRVSQDRMEELERVLQLYVEAITVVVEQRRGDLGDGLFYGGEYVVEFDPVKHGGKNFLQSARVMVEIDGSLG